MKKFTAVFFVIALIMPLAACGENSSETKYEEISLEELSQQKEAAIREASELFRMKRDEGMDFSNGPCLAEDIANGWSVDIVHLPRTEEDDKPENQCAYYRQGKTKHFIELSLDGDLVRAK